MKIDSELANVCQKAAQKAMVAVCGDSEKCENLNITDDNSGNRVFKYEVCTYELDEQTQQIKWGTNCKNSIDEITQAEQDLPWAGKLSGIVYWNNITFDEDGTFTTADEYIAALERSGLLDANDTESQKIIRERVFGMEIGLIENTIANAMRAIESDPTVDACLHGKTIQGIGTKNRNKSRGKNDDDKSYQFDIGDDKSRAAQRFPNLTKQMRQIITVHALNKARSNYLAKYDEEIQRMMQDKVKLAARIDHAAAVDAAAQTCKDWAENSGLPISKTPTNVWKWVAVGIVIAAAIVGSVFTAGASLGVGAAVMATALGAAGGSTIATATAITAATVVGATAITAASVDEAQKHKAAEIHEAGHTVVDQWNYKATINTLFNETTGVCTKETISQNCEQPKSSKCKKWADSVTTRDELKLL